MSITRNSRINDPRRSDSPNFGQDPPPRTKPRRPKKPLYEPFSIHENPQLLMDIAAAWETEYRRWIFRRKMEDKSAHETIREHDPDAPISEENQEYIADCSTEDDFEYSRSDACAQAVLTLLRKEGWKDPDESPESGFS